METLNLLLDGFSVALSPMNIMMALWGALIGTLVGMLPGLGPTSTIAILLPVTTVLGPTEGIIMLAGIYYGSMYGGSTTAILLNIPGEVSAVPTSLDGYPLAKQGRGGPALGIAAIGSFVAGTMGVIGLVFFAPLLADQALKFGSPEYFALMFLALTVIVNLAGASLIKGLIMGLFGYLLSMTGVGLTGGQVRFSFGIEPLQAGIDIISVVIGLFAISEVIKGMEENTKSIAVGKITNIYPKFKEIRENSGAMFRGGLVGFFLGLLPGCSAAVTTFLAYDLEKKVSKHPERFGHGEMKGVAAPEAANNATSSSGFIPLFALGIPSSTTLAVLLAGFMINGLTPGPTLFEENGEFVWAVIASMFVGNVMLLVLNLPLIGLWAKLTKIPYGIMGPVILILSFVGAYSINNSLFDVFIAIIFGVIGYFLNKYRWPVVPLLLAFVLGPMFEKSFIQSMAMSKGSFAIFFTRPISLTIFLLAIVLFVLSIVMMRRTKSRVKDAVGSDVEITE
ncbi:MULTISPECIES: tripartite tricarboxylate transporter permease [Brevibacillus]|uniref:Tripartite tricarboxylate transporter permease n=1 Tax=Brevibacillus invocatus TaxID=173959 RepID=A0A3M8CKV6_9BACL|nr:MULTISPECIES: tripartite tricarboxylate transporter permease [Brevibacillus]MCM3078302.1 tripartite tricarboxylate transporter permease [Brevibacillus invocatus]MCM3428543.1 tripartite tricarboxylate transporter permease [Brevibacillus invocatus]MDH4616916.1 tripartite tricarboxylate transporter permease [Brevibacillus sp. AY1]RNB76181.1 tripartite tricarboxylate transporter permease [Brevibacillus invocatus]